MKEIFDSAIPLPEGHEVNIAEIGDAPWYAEEMAKVQAYSDEFDLMAAERHDMGARKYGPVRFAEIDPLQMALEEVADLANYARYTFIKIRMLQDAIEQGREGWKAAGTAQPTADAVPTILGTRLQEGQFISLRRD